MPFTVTVTERGEPSETLGFSQPEVTIGRVRGNDLVLRRVSVSKHHAKLVEQSGRIMIADLGSTNGTILNGQRIDGPEIVSPGDTILVGDYLLEFEIDAGPGTADDATPPPRRESLPETESSPSMDEFAFRDPTGESQTGPREAVPVSAAGAPAKSAGRPIPPPIGGPASAPRSIVHVLPRSAAAPAGLRAPRQLPDIVYEPGFQDTYRRAVATVLSALPIDAQPSDYPPSDDTLTTTERVVRMSLSGAELAASDELVELLLAEFCGLGPLEYYLDDAAIDEVRTSAWDGLHLCRSGEVQAAPLAFGSPDTLAAVVRRISRSAALESALGGEARLADGTRIHVVMPPVSCRGPVVFVQRAGVAGLEREPPAWGSAMEAALTLAMKHQARIVVCATDPRDAAAVVNRLVAALPDDRSVVTIDPDGLIVTGDRPAARLDIVPGAEPTSLGRAGRLSPDVVAVAPLERDSLEELLGSCGSAPSGLLATLGARSPEDALSRLEFLALQGTRCDASVIRRRLTNCIDLVVQVRILGGALVVSDVVDIDEELRPVPIFEGRSGDDGVDFRATGAVPRLFRELELSGDVTDTKLFDT